MSMGVALPSSSRIMRMTVSSHASCGTATVAIIRAAGAKTNSRPMEQRRANAFVFEGGEGAVGRPSLVPHWVEHGGRASNA